MTIALERLSRAHKPLLRDFENEVPELVVYLRRWALAHQDRDHLSRTWVAVDHGQPEPRIAGFFSLAAASLERGLVVTGDLDRLPRFPLPGVLLARLAVDQRVQGQGVGTWLFDEALRRTIALAADGPIAFRVLITDAKDERAAVFYERRGMTRLTDSTWPCRMVVDLRPLLPK